MEGETDEAGIYSGVSGDESPARASRPAGLYSAIKQARQTEGETYETGIHSGVSGNKSPARASRPAGLYSGNPTNPTSGG